MEKNILAINAGSSSIKFALFRAGDDARCEYRGSIERIGLPNGAISWTNKEGVTQTSAVEIPDTARAAEMLFSMLNEHTDMAMLAAVGHRFVHGMDIADHAMITDALLAHIRSYASVDPEHLPLEIAIVESFKERFSSLMQVACFDTVFHHDMPRVAQLLAIPRRFEAKGVRRYGFHGLSCAYLTQELRRVDPVRAEGKVIIAHLGSGASITAALNGKSIDTSMGFSPAGGIPMSSRMGDVDPGALSYIMKSDNLTPLALEHLISYGSGLLGVSETTPDMHDLIQIEETDMRAKEAIALFCYEAKKRIGAYMAVLGGVDAIIFSGGIGSASPRIRATICEGLESFGIMLDESKNQRSDALISGDGARVSVHVMHTDEERMIARITGGFIHS